jgi:hypothetical protein
MSRKKVMHWNSPGFHKVFFILLLFFLSTVHARNVSVELQSQPHGMISRYDPKTLPRIQFMTLTPSKKKPRKSSEALLQETYPDFQQHLSITNLSSDKPAVLFITEFIIESESDTVALVQMQYGGSSLLNFDPSVLILSNITATQTMTRKGLIRFHIKDMNYYGAGTYVAKITVTEPVLKTFQFTARLTKPSSYYRFHRIVPLMIFILFCSMIMFLIPVSNFDNEMNVKRKSIFSARKGKLLSKRGENNTLIKKNLNDNKNGKSNDEHCTDTTPLAFVNIGRSLRRWWIAKESKPRDLQFIVSLGLMQIVPGFQLIWNTLPAFYLGDENTCYFNFFCAHQYDSIYAINKVISGSTFIMGGIFYIWMVFRESHSIPAHLYESQNNKFLSKDIVDSDKGDASRRMFGLYYSIGGCLILEGIMWIVFNLCPNLQASQFTSSFLYLTLILITLCLYLKGDFKGHYSFPKAYLLFTFTVIVNVFSDLMEDPIKLQACVVIYFLIVGLIDFRIYMSVRWDKKDGNDNNMHSLRGLSIAYFLFVVIGIILIVITWVLHWRVSTSLTAIAGVHIFIYFFYHGWINYNILWHSAWFYSLIGGIIMSSAVLYELIIHPKDYALSAAILRASNEQCKWIDYYDTDDVLAIGSAMAIFLICTAAMAVPSQSGKVNPTEKNQRESQLIQEKEDNKRLLKPEDPPPTVII